MVRSPSGQERAEPDEASESDTSNDTEDDEEVSPAVSMTHSITKAAEVEMWACWKETLSAWNCRSNWDGVHKRTPGSLDCLDGIRGIAVLWVILYHCAAAWQEDPFSKAERSHPALYNKFLMQAPLSGEMGVTMFFVLSGFLIALQGLRELSRSGRINYPGFLWARWWRIAPTFYASILVMMGTNTFNQRHDCLEDGWSNVLFINGGFFDSRCMIWTWSISLEFQFYLITPGIIYACCYRDGTLRPHCFKLLFALAAAVQTTRIILWYKYRVDPMDTPQAITNNLWTSSHTYLCGIAACFAYRAELLQKTPKIVLAFFDVLAFIIFGVIAYLGNGDDEGRWAGQHYVLLNQFLVLFAQILFAASTGWVTFRMCSGGLKNLNWFLSLQMWVPFARLSFCAYLLQFIGIEYLHREFLVGEGSKITLVAWIGFSIEVIVVAFFVALIHHLIVEGPTLRLRKFLTPRCLEKG